MNNSQVQANSITISNVKTFAELLAILPGTGAEETPGIRQLHASSSVVLSAKAHFGVVDVYANGFYTYTDGKSTTVLGVDRCNTLRDDDSPEETFTVEFCHYEKLPWMIPLEIAGIYALSNNAGYREKRKSPVSLDALADQNIHPSITPPDHVVQEMNEDAQKNRERRNRGISATYASLLSRQKAIFHMAFIEKLHQKQIAERLGVDRTAITHSLARIRKRFQKFL